MVRLNYDRILILDLLEVFQNYTDDKNYLTQWIIINILENDYGYEDVRRQTGKNNIEKLSMRELEILLQEFIELRSKIKIL